MTDQQCLLCYGQEWFHHTDGTFKPFRHGKDTEGFICSYCTRALADLAGEALKEAHRKAVERNRTALASILENMMEEENVPKTDNPRLMWFNKSGHFAKNDCQESEVSYEWPKKPLHR